jgi:hypothetical protein
MKIEDLIGELSKDPFNPELNFACAVEYEKSHQTASAVSFYLRCAEYSTNKSILVYNSLLKLARCFEEQNDRVNTVSNCILQAVAVLPDRQEAYFMMSQFHERQGNWQECYTWAEMGALVTHDYEPLPADVGFAGWFVFDFEQAVSAWWIGRREESLRLLTELSEQELPKEYADAVKHNLERINAVI